MNRLHVFIFVILFLGCFTAKSQNIVPVRFFEPISVQAIDSLDSIYGNNKTFINQYKAQCLLALHYFPDLKDVKIRFRLSKREKTTMACRPSLRMLLGGKRSYNIFINTKKFDGILLSDVPFNAQIGIIGHELTHISDYETLNPHQIMRIGILYLNKKKRKTFEYFIDMSVIKKGLGWQLYDWAVFSMIKSPQATEDYKAYKKEMYMNPELILENIQNDTLYRGFFIEFGE